MALWIVRAGKYGEREDFALANKMAVIGWEEMPDMGGIQIRASLHTLLQTTYPDEKKRTLSNWEGQLWQFLNEIQPGDLVALPLKQRSTIAIGEVAGPYCFQPGNPANARHTRPVKSWQELPRNQFDQDLLYSFGSLSTVCQIRRNQAEQRVHAMLAGKKSITTAKSPAPSEVEKEESLQDLEQYAKDQISEHIIRQFKGHGLAQLVGAILEAQGYQIQVSPPGADGGVDIIAGRGPLGFDPPRLAVQVKSSDTPIDIKVMRELSGVMDDYKADQGLVVSWGGYKGSYEKEAARNFFKIRLWDAGDLVRMIQENYEKLPANIQADLPLKRIWVLVVEEEGE